MFNLFRKSKFKYIHQSAKAISCFFVILLMFVSRSVPEYSLLIDIGAVVVWFFATSPTAYLIEKILKVKHKHDLI